jgi:hypothetical protein
MLASQTVSATLYRLADWFKPDQESLTAPSRSLTKASRTAPIPQVLTSGASVVPLHAPRVHTARRPLRVVRVLEADPRRASTGRMVISGCMADVCAELDRMIQKESMMTQ